MGKVHARPGSKDRGYVHRESGGSGTNATAVFQPCNRAYYISNFSPVVTQKQFIIIDKNVLGAVRRMTLRPHPAHGVTRRGCSGACSRRVVTTEERFPCRFRSPGDDRGAPRRERQRENGYGTVRCA